MFNQLISSAELEVKRGTLSRLQKHEEKRQQREITAAAAKAELESKTKVPEKDDDVSSEVSSEDLEEYMDSVFQVVKRGKICELLPKFTQLN